MWFLITKILKQKSIQIRTLFYNFLDTPDTIKLLSRIVPELSEANADCANAGRGAHGPAAGGAWGRGECVVVLLSLGIYSSVYYITTAKITANMHACDPRTWTAPGGAWGVCGVDLSVVLHDYS